MEDNGNDNNKMNVTEVPMRPLKAHRATYLARPATLLGAVTLAGDLATKGRPEEMGAAAEVAFDDMVELRAVGQAALEHQAVLGKVELAGPRNAMMGAYAGLTASLDPLTASAIEPLASEARAVSHELLGEVRPLLIALGPRELKATVERVRDKLARSPELRTRVDALVRPELTDRLLTAYAALEAAVATSVRQAADRVDAVAMTAALDDAINHLALCVLASARPRDEAAVARAEAYLRPILEHRVVNRRRKGRRAKAADPEVVEPAPIEPTLDVDGEPGGRATD